MGRPCGIKSHRASLCWRTCHEQYHRAERSEEVLRQIEERFRRLVEVMPVAVYVCDTSGIIQNYNKRAVELWGREPRPGDPAQRYCGSLRLYSPDGTLVPHQESKMAEVLRTGIEARDLEVVIERPDGSRITVLVNIVPLRNGDGELIGAMNCFQDITDRKRAEEALRESERLLRLVLDALPVGVAVVDRSGDIILSNPASQRIWGGLIRSGPERYAESKGWWHATGKRLAPEEWASVRALVNGETSVNEVIEIEAFDGVRKIIQNSAVPIRDANERITGAVVVNEDISARKTAERELNDSYNQMRTLTGRLMRAQDDERRRIAQMLHETTAQNLAALKMLLARLNRTSDRLSDSERSALTESMSLAEQSMTEIRTLSYLLHPPFLDETGLLSALRWYAAGFAERSGITVDLDLPESFERLPLDTETALFRIVQESLINIHRHAGSETARIRLQRDAETLVLEIDDRGHGIPKASLEHITSGGGVVGVGIAGMSERIEQLGGRLEITSGDQRHDRARAVAAREGRRLMSLRILVVDDHAVVRRGVRSLLESHEGWEVCGEATTGRDAVEQSRQLRPDVVVMDLSLPELNGLDATRQILKDAPGIEVLVLTMHHSEELARDVLQAGARGYVMKSDADENLIAAVDSLRQHKPFLTSTVTEFVLDDYVRRGDGAQADLAPVGVTSREREIIQLVAEGRSNKEAASTLGISVKTIEAHRANIMRKLHLRSVSDLVRYAIRNKIVQP